MGEDGNMPPREGQTSLFREKEEEGEEEPTAPASDRVVELGNTHQGCWKLLADGRRIELNEAEWPVELAHLFSRNSPTQ